LQSADAMVMRQRMGESGAHINDRGMVLETPRGRSGSTNKFGD
jgi:hypothetical protein